MCLDAADINSYPRSGTVWYDLSGKSNHGTLSGGPTYSSNVGGVVKFAAGVSYGNIPSLNLSVGTSTIMGVCRYAGGTRGRIINGNGNNWLMGHWSATTENYYAEGWVSTSSGDGANDQVFRIYAATGDTVGDTWAIWVNGNIRFRNNGGTQGPNGLSLACVGNTPSIEPSDCEIGLILAYNRVLTDNEIKLNMDNLRVRFGL